MEIRVPYGRSFLAANIPAGFDVEVIEPPDVPAAADPLQLVRSALEGPLGDIDLSAFTGAKSVAIAINDKTRPVPHQHLLPPLLARLEMLGIPAAAIKLFVAVGTHPPMRPDELPAVLPEAILRLYPVVSHDAEDAALLVYLGETARGTPVWANKVYVQSDLKIVIGNIEPHQFVGFSGGVKSAAIGLAGLKTINANHTLMTHPAAQLGTYATNPARQDVEAIGAMFGIQLAVNAILNQSKQIVQVLAGAPDAVMRAGIPLSRQVCQVEVPARYRVLISSPGGHPKDINLYQAQKGLAHAALITPPGGTIILTAACPEGTGSPHYEEWMLGKASFDEVFRCFSQEGFHIGLHKAYQIARDAAPRQLMFCSEMDARLARTLLLNPVPNLQTALDTALAGMPPGETIGVMPHASSTIPYLKQ